MVEEMAQPPKKPFTAQKALEITMQDALSDLEDFVTRFAYQSTPGSLTILSIEPPETQEIQQNTPRSRATVHRVTTRRSKDVVSFLMERESREERQLRSLRLSA